MITIKTVTQKKDLRAFIHLPFVIHKSHLQWIPPLIADEWALFDPRRNHSFESCDTILLLAQKQNSIVGRIMGVINPVYNKAHQESAGRFCFMECFDDAEVFDALIGGVEKWARSKGMEKLVGPLGFSDKDPQGFLIEGFRDPMTVMVTNCSFPYMVHHTQRNGYEKKLDLYQYRIEIPEKVPDIYFRIAERVKNNGYEVIPFKSSRQIRPFVPAVFRLINETYTDIYGFTPLSDIESKEFSERFLPLLKHEYIKLVRDKNGELVAFLVAMPNISPGLKKARGKLFPFGIFYIFRSMKKTAQLDLLLGCVKNQKQNAGLVGLLITSSLQSAKKGGFRVVDSHLVMEENTKMRFIFERFGGKVYKKYRIFEKQL